MTTHRIALVAGEPSGDRLGAGLIKALQDRLGDVAFFGMAGEQMIAEGCEAIAHTDELSVMGIAEVARSYVRLRQLRTRLGTEILRRRPHVVIGIDVPDFNFGLERRMKSAGVPTVHYVCPQAWAWRPGRARKMSQIADLWLAVLPFEPEFFSTFGVETRFVGHPLADDIPLRPDRCAARDRLGLDRERPVLALLPGSRKQELKRHLPAFTGAARALLSEHADLQLVAGSARPDHAELFATYLGPDSLRVVSGASKDVLMSADTALVASGTITLEALLCRTPAVVAYQLAPLSYHIIRHMVRVPHIALSNIVAGRELVPELIQEQVTADNLAAAVNTWIGSQSKVEEYRVEAERIHRHIRCQASMQAANAILHLIDGKD